MLSSCPHRSGAGRGAASHLRWVVITWLVGAGATPTATPVDRPAEFTLQARIVATGLHRAYGVRQVGRFHGGGPFTSNPEFLLQTQAGRVLDPERLLIAVEHNFGAARGNPSQAEGALLSIDPRAASDTHTLTVPADLAARPGTPGAAVMLYSAQSPRFLNRQHNDGARTAGEPAVSGPRYISINNAFGRPWVANAPSGIEGPGSESVLDPDGTPLANAPSDAAGGVFVGARTARASTPRAVRTGWWSSLFNRLPSGQLTPGSIDRGGLGTALLGASPDGSGFAVFAVVTGAGAVVQVHVRDGVDGLAPPGTIDVGSEDPGVVGIALKWVPDRALFVAEAGRNRIAVLRLSDDTRHFKVESTRHIQSPWLDHPADLAACMPEIANPRFASHTTLAGDSDLYVVNRGDGALLRVRQDGTVVARAAIAGPDGRAIGAGRLRSIAVAADASRVWLIAQTADGSDSVLLETSGFDASGALGSGAGASPNVQPTETAADGARIFSTAFTPVSGLGPLFNARSCVACHPGPGGASSREEHFARRVARMEPSSGRIVAIRGQPSAFAPRHSTAEMGERDVPAAQVPRSANVVSLRMPLALSVAGRLDEIPDAVIEAQAVSKGDGIKGRVHYVAAGDGSSRVGRYGWKADVAQLDEMVAQALHHEIGITSTLSVPHGAAAKDDGTMVRSLSAFVRTLDAAALAATPGESGLKTVEARR